MSCGYTEKSYKEGIHMTDKRLTLEKRIEAELKSYDGLMGIYLNDLKGNELLIRAEEKFETASCCKMFILTALFDAVARGQASLSDELIYEEKHAIDGSGVICSLAVGTKLSVLNTATLMIIVSDNIATNMLIDYLGLAAINDCIQKYGWKDSILHNPIDFARYDKLGTSTPKDYGDLFQRIARGTLVNSEASRQMLTICEKQHYNSMLTKFFPPYYTDPDNYEEQIISIASKSGSMDACRNDGGIVSTPYGRYVIVLFNKDFSDRMYYPEHPATVFGARVSRLVFDQYLALEGRFSA